MKLPQLKIPRAESIAWWVGVPVALGLSILFFRLADKADFKEAGTWLMTANFATAFFAINFAFIGYNLSPYSKLWRRLSGMHWIIFGCLLLLPVFPAFSFLMWPGSLWHAALVVAPWVAFLAIHAYLLTAEMLDPTRVLAAEYTDQAIEDYRKRLESLVDEDRKRHEATRFVPLAESPMHLVSYRPQIIETRTGGMWDRLMAVLSIAADMHDFAVFAAASEKVLAIYKALMSERPEADSGTSGGLRYIAGRRLRSALMVIGKSPSDGVFMEAVINRLCEELTAVEALKNFRGEYAKSLPGVLAHICKEALVAGKPYDALKGLNAIHSFTSAAAKQMREGGTEFLDPFIVAGCANLIKGLGQNAITAGNVEFLYRCLDALVWLGCEMAKHKISEPLKACIAGLVQLGREARHKKLQCFWERCILPPHIHAEEKLGDILTWLVQSRTDDGYFCEDTITEAYCRLRGFECRIEPKPNLNPAFWIKDTEDAEGKRVPHKDSLMGADGYNWTLDYSDPAELKEYCLY